MEWVIYLSGVSSGAFVTLLAGTLVFFYKSRGFRIKLGIDNPAVRRDKPDEDYWSQAHAESVSRGASERLQGVPPGASETD